MFLLSDAVAESTHPLQDAKSNGVLELGEAVGSEEDDVVGNLPNGGSHQSGSTHQVTPPPHLPPLTS